jgi:hypothetical protein
VSFHPNSGGLGIAFHGSASEVAHAAFTLLTLLAGRDQQKQKACILFPANRTDLNHRVLYSLLRCVKKFFKSDCDIIQIRLMESFRDL